MYFCQLTFIAFHDILLHSTVVILSHGNEGILYGYDSSYPVHKVWQFFTPDNSPSLGGKPKLMFLQACPASPSTPASPSLAPARTASPPTGRPFMRTF